MVQLGGLVKTWNSCSRICHGGDLSQSTCLQEVS